MCYRILYNLHHLRAFMTAEIVAEDPDLFARVPEFAHRDQLLQVVREYCVGRASLVYILNQLHTVQTDAPNHTEVMRQL